MSPTPEGKKRKTKKKRKHKRGNQQLRRWTTRCAGLEAALSWRQSRGSRRSWQKHEQNITLCLKESRETENQREQTGSPYLESLLLCSEEWNGRSGAQSRGSPAQQRLRSQSAPTRVICAPLFPEESLWTSSGMPNRRALVGGGGVDSTASGDAPKTQLITRTISWSTNSTRTLSARLPAVPPSSPRGVPPQPLHLPCAYLDLSINIFTIVKLRLRGGH